MIVAIDGPAGVGKSTVAKLLASQLGYLYFDTGSLYRSVAWAVLENGLNPDDSHAVAGLLPKLSLQMTGQRQGRVCVGQWQRRDGTNCGLRQCRPRPLSYRPFQLYGPGCCRSSGRLARGVPWWRKGVILARRCSLPRR